MPSPHKIFSAFLLVASLAGALGSPADAESASSVDACALVQLTEARAFIGSAATRAKSDADDCEYTLGKRYVELFIWDRASSGWRKAQATTPKASGFGDEAYFAPGEPLWFRKGPDVFELFVEYHDDKRDDDLEKSAARHVLSRLPNVAADVASSSATSAPAPAQKACDLLPLADARVAIGASAKLDPSSDNDDGVCSYTLDDRLVELLIWDADAPKWKNAKAHLAKLSGYGDEAYFSSGDSMWFRKGPAVYELGVLKFADARDDGVVRSAARLVLARLSGGPSADTATASAAPAGGGAQSLSLCALLTLADVKPLIGESTQPNANASTSDECAYANPAQHSRAVLDHRLQNEGDVPWTMAKAHGKKVAGVGEEAYSMFGALWFEVDGSVYMIGIDTPSGDDDALETAAAHLVTGRLGR